MKKLFLIPKNETVKTINVSGVESTQKTVRDSYYEEDELISLPGGMYWICIDDGYRMLISRSQLKTMIVRDFKDSDLTSDDASEYINAIRAFMKWSESSND